LVGVEEDQITHCIDPKLNVSFLTSGALSTIINYQETIRHNLPKEVYFFKRIDPLKLEKRLKKDEVDFVLYKEKISSQFHQDTPGAHRYGKSLKDYKNGLQELDNEREAGPIYALVRIPNQKMEKAHEKLIKQLKYAAKYLKVTRDIATDI